MRDVKSRAKRPEVEHPGNDVLAQDPVVGRSARTEDLHVVGPRLVRRREREGGDCMAPLGQRNREAVNEDLHTARLGSLLGEAIVVESDVQDRIGPGRAGVLIEKYRSTSWWEAAASVVAQIRRTRYPGDGGRLTGRPRGCLEHRRRRGA